MNKQLSKSDLSLSFGRSINELRMAFRKHMQGKIRSLDLHLTFEMLEVMLCLWRQDGVNQQVIADITLRDKSAGGRCEGQAEQADLSDAGGAAIAGDFTALGIGDV